MSDVTRLVLTATVKRTIFDPAGLTEDFQRLYERVCAKPARRKEMLKFASAGFLERLEMHADMLAAFLCDNDAGGLIVFLQHNHATRFLCRYFVELVTDRYSENVMEVESGYDMENWLESGSELSQLYKRCVAHDAILREPPSDKETEEKKEEEQKRMFDLRERILRGNSIEVDMIESALTEQPAVPDDKTDLLFDVLDDFMNFPILPPSTWF